MASQSVLTESYWKELQRRFDRFSLSVFHVLLHADPEMLALRILADQEELKAGSRPGNGGSITSAST